MDGVEPFGFFLGQVLQAHRTHGEAGGFDARQDLPGFPALHSVRLDDRKRSFHKSVVNPIFDSGDL